MSPSSGLTRPVPGSVGVELGVRLHDGEAFFFNSLAGKLSTSFLALASCSNLCTNWRYGPEQPRLLESKPPRQLEPLGGALDTLQHRLAVDDDDDDAGKPQAEWASVVFCASLTVGSISWVSMMADN